MHEDAKKASLSAPLVPVAFAFLTGILLGTSARLPPMSFIIVGVVSAGVSLWRWRRSRSGVIALLLLWGCLGALRMIVWERHPDMHLKTVLSDDPQPVQLHGLVVGDPVEFFEPGDVHAADEMSPRADPGRQVCVLELRHRETVDGWQPIHGRVRMTVLSPRALLRYGDEILVEGQWSRVPAPGNPGQYDWQAALERKRIRGLLRVRPFDGLVVLRSGHHRGARGVPNARAFGRHGKGNPILAAVFRLRERWVRLIRTHFEPTDAGLLLALLLGEQAEIDEGLKEAFQTTGTIHLLVISGFNVGLVAGLLELLLRLLGIPWRVRLALSAIGLGGYCLLTGLQPPVTRATLMAWVVLGALALDRVIVWPNALAAAALVILWGNPTQLFDPGCQLSFGAVLSLMLLTPRWHPALEARLAWIHPGWLRRYLTVSLAATSAVWVGLAPILAWYFQLLAPVSMVANLLLAPLMSALIVAGTALLLVATACEALMWWGGPVLTMLLHATIRCVSWCHAIPGGSWEVAQPSPWFLLGYYGLVGLSLLRVRLGWRGGRLLIWWVAALAVWAWSLAAARLVASRWLRVDVLAVGHGDSLIVRTPNGRTLVVDTGTEEAGRFIVAPFLRAQGLQVVDALILTHPDADHLGGAVLLLRELRVRRLLTNGVQDDTMSARKIRSLAAARAIPETTLEAGMVLDVDPAVRLEVLHPPRGLVTGSDPASNDNSVVIKVTKGSVSLLLSGDIEEQGLPWLLRQDRALRSTVLKVPHHGSRLGASGERFFDAVRPQVAILSVGRAHHLPARETVEALRRRGIVTYSTVRDGAVTIRTDGTRLRVRTFREGSQHFFF